MKLRHEFDLPGLRAPVLAKKSNNPKVIFYSYLGRRRDGKVKPVRIITRGSSKRENVYDLLAIRSYSVGPGEGYHGRRLRAELDMAINFPDNSRGFQARINALLSSRLRLDEFGGKGLDSQSVAYYVACEAVEPLYPPWFELFSWQDSLPSQLAGLRKSSTYKLLVVPGKFFAPDGAGFHIESVDGISWPEYRRRLHFIDAPSQR